MGNPVLFQCSQQCLHLLKGNSETSIYRPWSSNIHLWKCSLQHPLKWEITTTKNNVQLLTIYIVVLSLSSTVLANLQLDIDCDREAERIFSLLSSNISKLQKMEGKHFSWTNGKILSNTTWTPLDSMSWQATRCFSLCCLCDDRDEELKQVCVMQVVTFSFKLVSGCYIQWNWFYLLSQIHKILKWIYSLCHWLCIEWLYT